MSSKVLCEAAAGREPGGRSLGEGGPPGDAQSRERTLILESSLGLVEHVRHGNPDVPVPRPGPERLSPVFRVCLPYRGLLVVHAGDDAIIGDASRVLFATSGMSYRLSEPVPGGYAEVCITPALSVLTELLKIEAWRLPSHVLFRRCHRRADLRLQLLRGRFLHRADAGDGDPLGSDELLVEILRCALVAEPPVREPSGATRRLIGRAKEYVEAHLSDSLRLSTVSEAVQASAAYLTDVFRRFEGVPLHKYVLQARLARALVELPHADNLTTLALDLGFSSHSHLAAAFRSAFGCTPSAFRESARLHHSAASPILRSR